MKNNTLFNFLCISIILISASSSISADDDEFSVVELWRHFQDHVQNVYMRNVKIERNLENGDHLLVTARVYGYALGQQLKYITKDTKEHRAWLALEKKLYESLELEVKIRAGMGELSEEDEKFRNRLHGLARGAITGVLDQEMAAITGIKPGEAPSFFASGKVSTVKSLKGPWKMTRFEPTRANMESYQHKLIDLTDEIYLGAYAIKPADFYMQSWKLENDEIYFHDANGQVSYHFKLDVYDQVKVIWKGIRFHRGEVYQEAGSPVTYYLVRGF